MTYLFSIIFSIFCQQNGDSIVVINLTYNNKAIQQSNSDLKIYLKNKTDSLFLLKPISDTTYSTGNYFSKNDSTYKSEFTDLIIFYKNIRHSIKINTLLLKKTKQWKIEINSYPFWAKKKHGNYQITFITDAYNHNKKEKKSYATPNY